MTASSGNFDPRDHAPGARELRVLLDMLTPTKHRTPEQERNVRSTMVSRAIDIAADFSAWTRPRMPEKPISLPDDDDDMKVALRRAASAPRPGSDERAMLADHGEWRYACWKVQEEGIHRVVSLFEAAKTLEDSPDGAAFRDQIAVFLWNEWGIDCPTPTPNRWEAQRLARKAINDPQAVVLRSAPEPDRLGDQRTAEPDEGSEESER